MPIIPAANTEKVVAALLLLIQTQQQSGTIGGGRATIQQYRELVATLSKEEK